MKVKVLKVFRDKYTKELYEVDAVIDIKKERFDEILTVGKFIEKIETKKAVKPAKDKTAE